MNEKSKVYVLCDEDGRILQVEGGYSMSNIKDVSEWTLIDEGYGDRYNLCQNNYFPKPIRDMRGIERYQAYPFVDAPPVEIIARFFKDGVEYVILERTQEEMDADYVPPVSQPTDKERIAALEEALTAIEEGIASV